MSSSIRVFALSHLPENVAGTAEASSSRGIGRSFGLSLRPRTLALGVAAVAGLLVVLGLVESYVAAHAFSHPVQAVAYRFRLDAESTIPMWFSSMLMMVCALLAAIIATVHRRSGGPDVWRWAMIAVALMGMSVDEAAVVHEMAIVLLRNLLHVGGVFYFAWVLVAIPAVVAVAALGAPMLRRLPRRTAWGLPLSAAVFCAGAIGMEMVGGKIFESTGEATTWAYTLTTTLEEGLEMAGLVVCFYVLLDYLAVLEQAADRRAAA